MLAKVWKKVLLAICIIACLYNVMSKIVNRQSLEVSLKSVDDGTTVFEIFTKKDKKDSEKPSLNDLKVLVEMEKEKEEQNKTTTPANTNGTKENQTVNSNTANGNAVNDNNTTEKPAEDKKSDGFHYSDMIFKW